MKRRTFTLGLLAARAAGGVRAQEAWPSRPVTIVVGFPPGTATDSVARLLADSFGRSFPGQRFIVENRPGQGGSAGAASVARAEPDGYTITVGASAPQAINPHIYPSLRYDPRTDFTPIGRIVTLPYVLVANREKPWRSMADLVAAAKAKPGDVSFASTGNGTTSHLLMAMFEHATGTRLNHIPYRGTAQSVTDIIAGRVDVTFDTVVGCLPFIQDDRVRPLAVGTEKRSSLLPNVPTTTEQGFPAVKGGAWLALFGPANLPAPIVAKLSDALGTALKDEGLLAKLRTIGTEPDLSTPEEMGRVLRQDYDMWGEIVKRTGAKAE